MKCSQIGLFNRLTNRIVGQGNGVLDVGRGNPQVSTGIHRHPHMILTSNDQLLLLVIQNLVRMCIEFCENREAMRKTAGKVAGKQRELHERNVEVFKFTVAMAIVMII